MMGQLHARLDPQGGLAGDMILAAIVDSMPQLLDDCLETFERLPVPEGTRMKFIDHHDGMFGGKRLALDIPVTTHHRSWRDIRAMIEGLDLDEDIRTLATEIFHELAKAEAQVHAKAVDDVVFHEIGAWDSIIDIALCAALIVRSNVNQWSVSPIPIGAGTVETMHGRISVPAPAVRLLLQGFDCFDDGIVGERITPTGAAIVKAIAKAPPCRGKLRHNGAGFGSRKLAGTSNCVWLSVFENELPCWQSDQILRIGFEIDDMTPEDLAVGMDNIRAVQGVVDVTSMLAIGKKGRATFAVRVMCLPIVEDDVTNACFAQTSTLGLRIALCDRRILPREERMAGNNVRIKTATRPNGQASTKAEMDDLAAAPDRLERLARAQAAVAGDQ